MLIIPRSYSDYCMISIDPGLGKCGVAKYSLSGNSEILSIAAYTLIQEKLNQVTGLEEDNVEDRVLRLRRLHMALARIFSIEKPAVVAYEAPFYNRFRPMAYGALTQVCDAVRYSALAEVPFAFVTSVEPMLVKKSLDATKGKGKDPVKEGMLKIKDIMSNLEVDIDTLDEHSIDAIGVGYAALKYRKNSHGDLR